MIAVVRHPGNSIEPKGRSVVRIKGDTKVCSVTTQSLFEAVQ